MENPDEVPPYKGRGRPRMAPVDRASFHLNCRIHQELISSLRKLAEIRGMTVSGLVNEALWDLVDETEEDIQ